GIEILTRTIKAIAAQEPKDTLAVVENLTARGHDFRNFCRDLLGLLRDLLVFKVSGENENLFDSALLNVDQMRELAADFSESDLIRFFNSLSETETKLKEASQSRFVLEVGLIKLIEMRRVQPIETIINRLASLEKSAGTVPQAGDPPSEESKAAAAHSEKKTLNINVPLEDISVFESAAEAGEPEIKSEPPPPTNRPGIDYATIGSTQARVPPISAEELEHVE